MKRIEKAKDQKKDWEEIWKESNPINKLVNIGRIIYNFRLLQVLDVHSKVGSFCELGCGTSSLLLKISQRSNQVVGIDYSNEALRKSKLLFKKNRISNARFVNDNCLNLKTKSKHDVVWSQGLIEHFDDPGKIIKEHLKITKEGGFTIISVPFKFSYMYIWYLLTRPKMLNLFWPWTEQIFFTKKSLKLEFEKYCKNKGKAKVKIYPIFGLAILFVEKNRK